MYKGRPPSIQSFTPTHSNPSGPQNVTLNQPIFQSNLKNCFPNFNFGTGGELFLGEDHWHKFSSPSKFLWPILVAIDNLYRSGNGRLLFQWWSVIVVLAAIGIVISATTSDCYFGGYWRSLFQRQLAIVGRKLLLSTLANSKNCSPDVVANTLCVCEKTDKIWFVANGWPNITRNARWSAFTSPNEAFASCSHYITHLFICSIRSCGQGFGCWLCLA